MVIWRLNLHNRSNNFSMRIRKLVIFNLTQRRMKVILKRKRVRKLKIQIRKKITKNKKKKVMLEKMMMK